MGENFHEGTSQSDPSAVPPLDTESLEDVPPRVRNEDRTLAEEPSIEEEPENQQTG